MKLGKDGVNLLCLLDDLNRVGKDFKEYGVVEWQDATAENHHKAIFYDKTKDNALIEMSVVDEIHHDIISYYGEDSVYKAYVQFDEDDNTPFIIFDIDCDYEDDDIVDESCLIEVLSDGSWVML